MDRAKLDYERLQQISDALDKTIYINAITGEKDYLYNRLKHSIRQADSIDIIVSFLMETGVRLLLKDLKEAITRGVKIRLLTGSYLQITEPSALYLIREELGDQLDLRIYRETGKSFHPKAYLFHGKMDSEIYIGSSNISRGALTESIEWNYRFTKASSPLDFTHFLTTFEELFYNHSLEATDEELAHYSRSWIKPRMFTRKQTDLENGEPEEKTNNVVALFEPRGAQIEALYALKQTREEGWDRGIVVAATGIGKTYLAAFDSKEYKRVLFIAHREEILRQAELSFQQVRETKDTGFFGSGVRQGEKEVVFALVQTMGKEKYLQEMTFAKDAFDYIVVDECHHATSKQYEAIRDYFKPKFWLFLTATPTRLDNEDVFELANYNTVYEVNLAEAINKDWLVPFRYYGIYDDTIDYNEITVKNGWYEQADLEKKLIIEQRAELVYKHYKKYDSTCTLGFCMSRAHAAYMTTYFKEKGVKAAAVYSGEQGKESMPRDKALAALANGKLQVIFSVDMFNEGVDVPNIDMVMFLRPTQSPVVFLQQLGRGLRKYRDKDYLIVLDFIGNYKRANTLPFLLGMREYTEREKKQLNPQQIEVPVGCLVDYDFRLIDLFKEMAKAEQGIREAVEEQYFTIKEDLGRRPTRVEFYTYMEHEVYIRMKSKKKENVLVDYLAFLHRIGETTEEENQLLQGRGADFIRMIETTDMSRTYKMPLLLTFYQDGVPTRCVTEEMVVSKFKDFYATESNHIDLLQDKGKQNYKSWTDKEWAKTIRDNPIKAFLNSATEYFNEEKGYVLAIREDMACYFTVPTFLEHWKDAVDYRLQKYYRERFEKKGTKK